MEGMDPVLFDKISQQAVKAEGVKGPKITEFDPKKHRIVTTADGKSETIKAIAPPRQHSVNDVDSLVRMATEFAKQDPPPHGIVCWASREAVILVLNDIGYRDDEVTMPMALSPQMKRLIEFQGGAKAFSQRDLIREFRINFRNCGLPETLVDLLRKVNFEVNESGGAEVKRTSVSVGRSQMAAFKGLDQLPEWLTFQVPTFATGFSFMALVAVALDPDPETQTFRLVPALGEIEKQIGAAEAALVHDLQTKMPDSVPVYLGSPE